MSSRGVVELVLVEDSADDEALSLKGIERSGVSCHVTVLRDGAHALNHLLGNSLATPALIVLDFHLPRITGAEVLSRLRENDATALIPVVMFSSTDDDRTLLECYRGGANSCVRKPDDTHLYLNMLADIVRYWLTINEMIDQRSR